MHSSRTEDLSEFLSSLYNTRISEPGKKIVVTFNRGQNVSQSTCGETCEKTNFLSIFQTFAVDVPRPFQLPSIPENVSAADTLTIYLRINFFVRFVAAQPHRVL